MGEEGTGDQKIMVRGESAKAVGIEGGRLETENEADIILKGGL